MFGKITKIGCEMWKMYPCKFCILLLYAPKTDIHFHQSMEINIEHIVQVRLFKTLLNMQQIRKGQMQLDNYYKISLIQLSCMCMDYNL